MPRIPRFGRPGALKIRRPPAPPVSVEAPATQTTDPAGAAVPPAPPSDGATVTAAPTSGTPDAASAPAAPSAPAPAPVAPSAAQTAVVPVPSEPSFRERAALRRRLRFLRSARELAFRDLGGLLFELHRLERSREDLVGAKLATLGRIDAELRLVERALADRQPITVLHEAGIAACRRCSAIHGSDARYCPNCGLAFGRRALVAMAAPTITPESTTAPAPPAPAGDAPAAPVSAAPEPASAAVEPATVVAPFTVASDGAAASPATPASPASEPAPGVEHGAHGGWANGESRGRAPTAGGGDGSEQPTRVVEAVRAEDGDPTAR